MTLTEVDPETRAKRLKAVGDPVRGQVIRLMCFGPGPGVDRTWTAKELGAELGRNPNALYHHLNVLEEAGIVVEAGVRPVGGRREKAYRGVANVMVPGDRTDPDAMTAYLGSILERAKWGVESTIQTWPASLAAEEAPLHATVNAPELSTTHDEVLAFQKDLMDLITTYRERARAMRTEAGHTDHRAPDGFRNVHLTWALWEQEMPYHLFTEGV